MCYHLLLALSGCTTLVTEHSRGGYVSINQLSPIFMAKPVIGDEEVIEVEAVLRSGQISDGEIVRKFEKEFAAYIGTEHAVAVNSGTAAIYVALLAHGIGPGDEVITTPFTFVATANAVLLTGALPVFADIQPDTYNINPDEVKRKITPATKAIIPVHLYGQPCDIDELVEIAGEYDLALIEDACQAHGAAYKEKRVGSFGAGCFSFYPTKNMTTGEGGIITTNDIEIARASRIIANHGQTKRYYHEVLGQNYRMTNISAALGLCQLKKLPYFNEVRIKNARILNAGLDGIKGILLPDTENREMKHVFHQYTIRLTEDFPVSRNEFREYLRTKGIVTEVYYPLPIHQQPLYKNIGYNDRLPEAEKAAREVVSLPVHPSVTEQELQYIIDTIRKLV
jgi:dTDP-4-amino-4,6-dideoxygalactose transaminase